ncbi:hypothetical protein DSO57_1011449 [Entomophthora muscae]|uniref:Uncharacterized protein n=1 Tax=Entomophthora muscae TaxID=34485 RepID=A0ACC2RL35_9FUNG|nr:hypothetical protein DSO57_1011449 [Entomophthora muscae]
MWFPLRFERTRAGVLESGSASRVYQLYCLNSITSLKPWPHRQERIDILSSVIQHKKGESLSFKTQDQ